MANITINDIKLTAEDLNQVKGGRAGNKATPILMLGYSTGMTSASIGSSTGGAGGAGKVKF